MGKLDNLEPKKVFYYFEELTKIPRCSKKEEKVSAWLENFAKERNLDYVRDEFNNIIIRKPGTSGYENSPTLIIQGHMDMVCEKTPESTINFDTDPIEFVVEGNDIIAKETTLGADNGIAVAMALAILDSDDIVHPPLEVLLTSDEETGMTGAKNLDGTLLKGKTLLNIDSEDEGVACIACAGGEKDYAIFNKEFKDIEDGKEFYEVSITGLKGGHSGQEADKGLGNANKLLARSLYRFMENFDFDLVDIEGGAKPNAIPRYAKAVIAINPSDKKNIQDLVVELNGEYVSELGKVDPDVRLNFESGSSAEKALTDKLKKNIIYLINVLPNGVQSMSHNVKGLVGCSINVGVIESDNNEIRVLSSIRSELKSLKKEVVSRYKIASELCEADFEQQSEYPAWEYKDVSPIRDIVAQTYKELFNDELKLEAIHAGLECGIFKESIGDIDMISIGPNIHGVHAPGETLEIESTRNVYKLILEILKKCK